MNIRETPRFLEIDAAYREIMEKGLAASGGRPFQVIGVTKTFTVDTVRCGYEAGLRNFGENYADELIAKASDPALTFHDDPIRWHFIGKIQSRKISKLARYVSIWHSVSRAKEVEQIASICPGAEIFIQVRFDCDPQRNGIRLEEVGELVSLGKDKGLKVLGLMLVPPLVDNSTLAAMFALVQKERLRLGLSGASMGMSDDYELALSKGSTHIRVGRVLFGSRYSGIGLGALGSNRGQGGPG